MTDAALDVLLTIRLAQASIDGPGTTFAIPIPLIIRGRPCVAYTPIDELLAVLRLQIALVRSMVAFSNRPAAILIYAIVALTDRGVGLPD